MAIKDAVELIDGFDGHNTTTLAYDYVVTAEATVQSSVARNGGKAVAFDPTLSNPCHIQLLNLTGRTQRYWGFAYRCNAHLASENILHVFETGILHVALKQLSDGRLQFLRNTTVLATSTLSISPDVWYWFDIRVSVADAGGRAVLLVNGVSFIDFTGDTKNGGTNQTGWAIGLILNGDNVVYLDDLHVLNGDHADATYIGDHRVDSLFPNAAGDSTQGTPSTGSNYQCVDEDSVSLTDYVDFGAVNDDDLYNLPAIASPPGTILCVATVMTAAKSDAGTCTMENQLKSGGGTTTGGTDHALSVTPDNYYDNYPDVPGGTGWTESDINAVQIGVNRVA